MYFDSLNASNAQFFPLKYVIFILSRIIVKNIHYTKYFNNIAAAHLLINYDFIFYFLISATYFLHGSWIHPSIFSRTMNWFTIDIGVRRKNFAKCIALKKKAHLIVWMVPTIKHDFVRRGSQRESFCVKEIEREELWRIARWNNETKTRVRSKSYTSRSFVLWDHCQRCCDDRRRKITFREMRPVLQREAQSVIYYPLTSLHFRNKSQNS